MERLHTRLKIALVICLTFISSLAYATSQTNNEKWYRVEVLVIESKDKSALTEEWPVNPGMPLLANAISLDNATNGDISLLSENQLTLARAKKRLQQNYRLIMHKGWRQPISDKATAQTIRLVGGQNYASNDAKSEVDGIIKLSTGRYMNVDADLVFYKPMKLAPGSSMELGVSSENQGTARFAEIPTQNWQNDPQARLQAFRLKESSRLKADEIHYIDHPLYGIIIVVTPEKTTT